MFYENTNQLERHEMKRTTPTKKRSYQTKEKRGRLAWEETTTRKKCHTYSLLVFLHHSNNGSTKNNPENLLKWKEKGERNIYKRIFSFPFQVDANAPRAWIVYFIRMERKTRMPRRRLGIAVFFTSVDLQTPIYSETEIRNKTLINSNAYTESHKKKGS